MPAGHRRVGLDELVEQRRGVFGGDADARVGHLEHQQVVAPFDGHRHGALVCELDGVRDQIVQDLADAGGIAPIDADGVRRDVQAERDVFLAAKRGEGFERNAGDLAYVHFAVLELQLA